MLPIVALRPGIIVHVHNQDEWDVMVQALTDMGATNARAELRYDRSCPYRRIAADKNGEIFWRQGSLSTYSSAKYSDYEFLEFEDLEVSNSPFDFSEIDSMLCKDLPEEEPT